MKKSDQEIETVKEVKPMRMFSFKSGLDQLPHLVSEESASSSHRSDLWVEKIYYPEKISPSGHPIIIHCWSSRA